MQIFATVENDTIKLPAGVHLPDGTSVFVEPVATPNDWPPDYFEQTSGALAGERFERPPQVAGTENRAEGLGRNGDASFEKPIQHIPLPAPRPAGLCAGEFVVPDDFDAPLPEEVLQAFEGR